MRRSLVDRVLAFPGQELGLCSMRWPEAADVSQGIPTGAPCGGRHIAFWLISIPVCYLLAHGRGLGLPGLLPGLRIGLSAAALLLAWRFRVLAGRYVQPL